MARRSQGVDVVAKALIPIATLTTLTLTVVSLNQNQAAGYEFILAVVAIAGFGLAVTESYLSRRKRLVSPSDSLTRLRSKIRQRINFALEEMGGAELIDLDLRGAKSHRYGVVGSRDIGIILQDPQIPRIVITGRPGSGKSVALIQIQRELFEVGDTAPIPVRIDAFDWASQSLEEWVVSVLVETYKEPLAYARELYRSNGLIVLIDGLDEMDPPELLRDNPAQSRARRLLRQIEQSVAAGRHVKVVLACRAEPYASLRAQGYTASHTTDFEIQPLSRAEVAYQLASSQRGQMWARLASDEESGFLIRLLANPFYLRLALDATPIEVGIVGSVRDLDMGSIERRLLEGFIDQRLGRLANCGWFASAETTLKTIACWLKSNDKALDEVGNHPLPTDDIVAHRLWPIAGRTRPRIVTAVLALVALAPLVFTVWVAIGIAEVDRRAEGAVWGAVIVLVAIAIVNSLKQWPHPKRIVFGRLRARRSWLLLLGSASVAITFFLVTASASSPGFPFGYSLGFFLPFGLGLSLAVRDSASASLLLGTGFIIGLPMALTASLTVGQIGYVGGLAAGLAAGLFSLVATVAFVLRTTRPPSGYRLDPQPYPFARNDLLAGIVSAVALSLALAPALVELHDGAFGVERAVVISLVIGLSAGFGFVSDSLRRQIATSVCMPTKIALNIGSVLNQARRVGLVRRSGISYQFRHRLVRDALEDL